MEIITVKEQRDEFTKTLTGYLVNGNISIPDTMGNRDRVELQKWFDAGNTAEPYKTDTEWLEVEKANQIQVIDREYTIEDAKPVIVTINSVDYTMVGGLESANRIDMAKRLLLQIDPTTVSLEITDNTKKAHTFTIAEVDQIVNTIGLKAQIDFLAKQTRKVNVDAIQLGDYIPTATQEALGETSLSLAVAAVKAV